MMQLIRKIKLIGPYLFWLIVLVLVAVQAAQYNRFMSRGPRFTAFDGQELCERVKLQEESSYGFHDKGLPKLPCDYLNRGAK